MLQMRLAAAAWESDKIERSSKLKSSQPSHTFMLLFVFIPLCIHLKLGPLEKLLHIQRLYSFSPCPVKKRETFWMCPMKRRPKLNKTLNRTQAPSLPTKQRNNGTKGRKSKRGRKPKKGKVLKVCYECNSVMVLLQTKGPSREACSSIIAHWEEW